jgi:signal transduction histidine kinase
MQESHKNNLLQLADYVASGINRSFTTNSKRKRKDFIKKINIREIYVQFWPKN